MTCAKRHVECRIETSGGEYVVGSNACANPQPACPRVPGDDYTKCKSICQQNGHAEVIALALAAKAGLNVHGGHATITGHYWICRHCGAALRDAGVVSATVVLSA